MNESKPGPFIAQTLQFIIVYLGGQSFLRMDSETHSDVGGVSLAVPYMEASTGWRKTAIGSALGL